MILVHKYFLKPKFKANTFVKHSTLVSGALISINGGYGCIHPHPELGDPTIDDLLEDLSTHQLHPLVKRSIDCCDIDSHARKMKLSLFKNLTSPSNHYLLALAEENSILPIEGIIRNAINEGFKIFKIKMTPKLDFNLLILKNIIKFANCPIKLRLDFNESLSKRDFHIFLQNLSAEELNLIEFIEDPFP
jgi:O-succinylbenzoate synthase